MPTTRSSSASSTTTTSSVATELADLLGNSQSTTIYVDAELTEDAAAALLLGDPPLHAEFDQVRGQWAVRKATEDEAAQAKAAADAAASSATPASSTA